MRPTKPKVTTLKMTTDDSALHHHRTIFDGWRSLTIGIYMALVGYVGVFISCASASIMAMLVYLYMYLMLRRKIPALADAS